MKVQPRRTTFLRLLLTGLLLALPVPAALAVDASFSWLPNTESTLAGYKIHYGTASRTYTQSVDIGNPGPSADGRVHGTVTGLSAGTTYYFAATAYDINGIESDFSQEVSLSVTLTAKPPTPTVLSTQKN